jgi:hypothetical protein
MKENIMLDKVIDFLDIIHSSIFYLKRFRDWILSPSSGEASVQLVPIYRASPYLRTSEPKQDRIYKPNAT